MRRNGTLECFKNITVFGGEQKEYEQFATKLRSQIAAGDPKVVKLIKCIENDCAEDELAEGRYNECELDFDVGDTGKAFVNRSSAEMYNLLFHMTTGEANAMIRRCPSQEWLPWNNLTASLNPRTLASGIKAISAVLSPDKITRSTSADQDIEQWEAKMARLNTE